MSKPGENIHQRKDGRWEGRFIKARIAEHKAIWGYIYGTSYEEVREILLQRRAESHFFQLSGKKVLFSELSLQWLASISYGVKESTLAHYQYTLQKYLLPVFGTFTMQQLDEQLLEQGIQQVISPADGSHKFLGASLARECLVMLRRICKYAAHLRLIRPMEIVVKLPQNQLRPVTPLSAEEQRTLQEFILSKPTPRKLGLLLQFQLGLRIGEVCGLQWSDFDLQAGILTVHRTVSRIYKVHQSTKVVIQTPKTTSSFRQIPLPKELISLLQSLINGATPETWFLSGKKEKPVEPRCYRKSIQVYLRQANVRTIHPHLLRHTFATTCLQAGCDIKTLSEILGHTDANITLKRYVHSNIERKRKELERIFAPSWKCNE